MLNDLASQKALSLEFQINILSSRNFFADADPELGSDAIWEQFYQGSPKKPIDGISSAAAVVAAPSLANKFIPTRRQRQDLPAAQPYCTGDDMWLTSTSNINHLSPSWISTRFDDFPVPLLDEAAFVSTRHRFHEVLMEITVTMNKLQHTSATKFHLRTDGPGVSMVLRSDSLSECVLF
jgi:hypothetical protein